jgi:hypothetical protein
MIWLTAAIYKEIMFGNYTAPKSTQWWPSAVELGDCRGELMLVGIGTGGSNARPSKKDPQGRSSAAR